MENTNYLQALIDSGDKKDVSRARQTFFRTSFKTHLTLASMADRKANIMVRLNSILLSALILFYKYIIEFSDLSKITIVLFLLTTLVSLVLAILVVRPVAVGNKAAQNHTVESLSEHIFSFKNFGKTSQKAFEDSFLNVLSSTSLLYSNMIKDLHSYDKYLSYKYRMLRFSYTVFLVGLILTVASFLVLVNFI